MLPKINENKSFTTIELPSGKSVGIHPWRVKEEKELLFALEGLDEASETYQQNAKIQMFEFVKKCVDKPEMFDVLSNTDILKTVMELRKLSKGDTIEYEYKCPHCGTPTSDTISITKHSKTKKFDGSPVKLNETLIFNIKEVPAKVLMNLFEKYMTSSNKFNYYYLLNSIESVVVDGEISAGFTIDELIEFIDQLTPNQYEELQKVLQDKLADVSLDRSYKCIKCKKDVEVLFGDLYDFLIF